MANNTPLEAPTIPQGREGDPPYDPEVEDLQKQQQAEILLQSPEVTQALELSQDLYNSESLTHDLDGFEQYWNYVVQKLGGAAQYLDENQHFYEHMREEAQKNYDIIQIEHQKVCGKTFEKEKEWVETEMVLSEEEVNDEELFHSGKEKLRAYLLRKIRDVKKRLNPETYDRLYNEVIEPLLNERVDQYFSEHEKVCGKTFEKEKEWVETEMVLSGEELRDDSLFEQGEGAIRSVLLRKIRDLKKRLNAETYQRLLDDVIEPLLSQRIAEYMNEYRRRKDKEKQEDEEDKRDEKPEEDENKEIRDKDTETDQEGEAATELSQENQQEAASEMTSENTNTEEAGSESTSETANESIQTNESSESADTAQAASESAQGSEVSQGGETMTSQESITESSEASAPSSEATGGSKSSGESTKKATELKAEPQQSEASEQQANAPSQEKSPDAEQFKLGELAGIKQLLAKGGAYFTPFLLKWENSLDSAQYRKAAHEISSGAKTAETFVQWLLADQQANRLKKQYLGEWQQFAFGLQLFGLAEKSQEKESPIQEEISEEMFVEETEVAHVEGLRDLPEEPLEEEEEEESTPAEVVDIAATEAQGLQDSESAELEIDPVEAEVPTVEELGEIQESSEQEEYVETFAVASAEVLDVETEILPLENIEEVEEESPEEQSETIDSHQEFLDEPFEAMLFEDENLDEQEGDTDIENMIIELEESEELVDQVEEMEDSLWEMVDDVMLTIEDSELGDEYAEELENLDALFQHLVEHGMELPQGSEPVHESEENQEECNAQNLRRLMLLFASLVSEQRDTDGRVQPRPRTTPELFQTLIEQLSGANSHQLEKKILAILRYYPQFRFLLLLMLRKQYLESQDSRYIRLMVLIYQEQYGTKVMGLHEMVHMLTRFIRFLGKSVETEQHIHEKLQDYTIINANEIFSNLSQRVSLFQDDIHRLQFVSGLHHCRFDQHTGQARALLHMNMEGDYICGKDIGRCRLIVGSERNLEAA